MSVVTHVAEMVARTKRLADSARRVTMTVRWRIMERLPETRLVAC